jgi:hypothetical protein
MYGFAKSMANYSTGQNKLYVIYSGVAVERWMLITVRYYTRSPIGLYGYAVIFAIIGRRNRSFQRT